MGAAECNVLSAMYPFAKYSTVGMTSFAKYRYQLLQMHHFDRTGFDTFFVKCSGVYSGVMS